MTETAQSISQALPIPEDKKAMVGEKVQEAQVRVSHQIRGQVETQATRAAEQVSVVATAVRDTGNRLQQQGQEGTSKILDQVAGRGDQLSTYLSTSDPDQLLSDFEDICRQQPWAVIGGGIVLGFVGARFLKATSSRRYQGRYEPHVVDTSYGGSY